MKPIHVPGFLMTHSALAFVFGLLCAWAIDLGNSVSVVVLRTRVDAGLLVSAGAVATLLLQRVALWGWKRSVRPQASAAPPGERRVSPAMAAPGHGGPGPAPRDGHARAAMMPPRP